jgi:sugar phosphate isomerase/epimerase
MVQVLTSTTSHKREALLPSLEVFARLGLRDIDLNLHHILELNTPVREVVRTASRAGITFRAASGGWCDFFHEAPKVDETFRSVAHQVNICGQLGVSRLRLFFGRLAADAYTPAARVTASANLTRLAETHPEILFVFENHDGASLNPRVCAEILAAVDRPNIRMNFDPINFERHGVGAEGALDAVLPFVAHVHLKGLEDGEFCEFGVGDVDLTPVLHTLARHGFDGAFSVEYEGRHDGTLRLYQSVERARAAIAAVFADSAARG